MHTRILAKQFKSAIVKDLSSLNGTQFEDLCRVIIELILDENTLHKGCNLNGKPVPYAVDIKTKDCRIVGQSGTDEDYFTKNDLEKPIHDISGTERNNPLCEELFLFSNQRDTDAQHTSLVTKINVLSPKFEVNIYDAENIAETIYNNINNPRCQGVWQYLSEAHLFYAIMPKKNCIPQSAIHYINRPQESKKIQELLSLQSVVEIVGVSGIGKSEFAKQIARDIAQAYETIIWIDGKNINSFDSVRISQSGYDVNLRFVIQNYKSLIIIDNLNEDIIAFCDDYNASNKKESKCIITTLKKSLSDKQTYLLPYLSDEQVGEYISSFNIDISPENKRRLMLQTGGYPLAVNIICSLVKDGTFSIEDLLENSTLQELEDDSNLRLSQRIIGKIYEKYAEELSLIAYMDSLVISSDYLSTSINKIRLKYLCNYSILQKEDAYTYRIHQVILESIKCLSSQINIKELISQLASYLDIKNQQKDIHFFTLFHYNGSFISKIYDLAEVDQKKVILYSQLQAENTFSNPTAYIASINKLDLNPSKSLYDCLLLIDRNEIEFSTLPKSLIQPRGLEMIENLKCILSKTTDETITIELLHHIGKLYSKLGDYDQSYYFFSRVLSKQTKAYATMLQLAKTLHLSKSRDKEEIKAYISQIFDDFEKGESVPLTIILSCYSFFLAKSEYRDLATKYIDERFDDFAKIIMSSLSSFNNQAVPTLGAFAYSLAYNNPDFMNMILSILPEPPSITLDKPYAQAYAFLKAVEYRLEEDKQSERAKTALTISKEYFALLNLRNDNDTKSKDYQRKRYVELLLDAGCYEEGIEFSECFTNKESEFYLQNMAKLYYGIKDYTTSLSFIDQAISKAKNIGYKTSFLWNKANILHDDNDSFCVVILREAIDMREEDKARGEWVITLREWEKEYNVS